MDEIKDVKKPAKEETIQVPKKLLEDLQFEIAENKRQRLESDAKMAGMTELLEKDQTPGTRTEGGLRKKTNFEPSYRTVRLRQYPKAGDFDNLGWVIGWSHRGAYRDSDLSGIPGQQTDWIDIMFLDDEKTKEGLPKFEKVRLLDLLNKSVQKHFEIIEKKTKIREVPTNEKINVVMFDPQHGLIGTGEIVDGYVSYSEDTYVLKFPGREKPLSIDGIFVN